MFRRIQPSLNINRLSRATLFAPKHFQNATPSRRRNDVGGKRRCRRAFGMPCLDRTQAVSASYQPSTYWVRTLSVTARRAVRYLLAAFRAAASAYGRAGVSAVEIRRGVGHDFGGGRSAQHNNAASTVQLTARLAHPSGVPPLPAAYTA